MTRADIALVASSIFAISLILLTSNFKDPPIPQVKQIPTKKNIPTNKAPNKDTFIFSVIVNFNPLSKQESQQVILYQATPSAEFIPNKEAK